MLEACRTCLGLIDVDESPYYEIEVDEVELSTESCRYKLLSIVPKMALDITPKSILCAECHESLESMFKFKEKCLKTENIITRYFQAQPGIKNIDLKDVSDFNTNNVRIIKDEDVETLFEHEFELSDTIITNAGVSQPKNAVPASLDDIVKDETIEISFEDDAFKGKVELSETIVTNVKDEINSLDSVAVAKNTINVVLAHKDDININENKIIKVSVEDDALKEKVELSETVVTNVVAKKKKKVTNSNLSCERCDKRFKYASGLKSHLRTHPGEKPYRCEICDRRYRNNSHLKVHMKIHTDDKPFRCEMCNDNFLRKYHLTKHLRTHKGLRLYVCVICKKGYSSKRALGVHRRIPCDTLPFKCTVCSKGFNVKRALTEHSRTHTGERPYQCETCQKGFTMRCHLIRHLRQVHSGIKNVECEYCKKRFFRKEHVKRHIMNVHKDVALKLR